MEGNNFRTDTQRTVKREFLSRISGVFMFAVLITGLCTIAGVIFLATGIRERAWEEMGMADFVWKTLIHLEICSAFASLVKIAIDEKPFSRTLTYCVRFMAGIFIAGSILIPRLSGYRPTGFLTLLGNQESALIDGGILLPGLLLVILSCLIKEGFEMQKEMDEIL